MLRDFVFEMPDGLPVRKEGQVTYMIKGEDKLFRPGIAPRGLRKPPHETMAAVELLEEIRGEGVDDLGLMPLSPKQVDPPAGERLIPTTAQQRIFWLYRDPVGSHKI